MKILHFADLHIGVENYGRLNPETGLNSRLEDFLAALDQIITAAIEEAVDIVIFAGDAFKVNEPSPTQQKVFAQRIWRLSHAGIPTFLLIGNHDQTNKFGEAHSLDIYATLNIPHVYVSHRPEYVTIQTRSAGPLQIVSLPHVSKSHLMTQDGLLKKNTENIEHDLLEQVDVILTHLTRQLDPAIPAILAAHAGIDRAQIGSEQMMSIGYGFTLPLQVVARKEYQYVALGHIHKHQFLCQDPPVVYPGSVERVDFGEEKEAKGFMLAELALGQPTQCRFIPLSSRRFITIDSDLQGREEPTQWLLKQIEKAEPADAVVRLRYTLEAPRAEEIDSKAIRKALESSFFFSIRPNLLETKERTRLPDLMAASSVLEPLKAVERYLEMRQDLKAVRVDLATRAEQLWQAVQNKA